MFIKKNITSTINLPGDKSLAHRAVILGAISNGITKIINFPMSKTCMATVNCIRELGIDIKIISDDCVIINGRGLYGFEKPNKILNAETSGTTLRLMLGLLVAQKFSCEIKCMGSLKNRPMKRVIEPLKKMGAKIIHDQNNACFKIMPAHLSGINYTMPVASAQVKSAIILAGLYCDDTTKIIEPKKSRDHTENMINYFGNDIIKRVNNTIYVKPNKNLYGREIKLAGDISSAAFFIVLALLSKSSHLILKDVLYNQRRMGLINTLKKMGANIDLSNIRKIYDGEYVTDIEVRYSELSIIEISDQEVIDMIDEIPIFVISAIFAQGTSIIKDAEELHFKESDRINCLSEELNKIGAKIKPTNDGMIIHGRVDFDSYFKENKKDIILDSHNDHRLAMSFVILSLLLRKKIIIKNIECISDSFPSFFEYINKIKNQS